MRPGLVLAACAAFFGAAAPAALAAGPIEAAQACLVKRLGPDDRTAAYGGLSAMLTDAGLREDDPRLKGLEGALEKAVQGCGKEMAALEATGGIFPADRPGRGGPGAGGARPGGLPPGERFRLLAVDAGVAERRRGRP
jgi:hypothetical protein